MKKEIKQVLKYLLSATIGTALLYIYLIWKQIGIDQPGYWVRVLVYIPLIVFFSYYYFLRKDSNL